MKVCSLYGAGYYYIPGTDICLKLGGYVRYQHNFNQGTSISSGSFSGAGGRATRTDSVDQQMRTRAVATIDTRQQTAYGTLRTYMLLGYQQDSSYAATTSPGLYMTRGFLQFAGFTFGKAVSFYDIFPSASFAYNAGNIHTPDTGDGGQMVAAYTAQFGNGFSATIAAEQNRRGVVFNGGAAASLAGGAPIAPAAVTATPAALASTSLGGIAAPAAGALTAGAGMPDIVANLRIDQSWGSALIAGALHDASGGYYTPGTTVAGHPSDTYGWAFNAGFILNLPMIAAGDRLSASFSYTEGAIKYATNTASAGNLINYWSGSTMGFGLVTDAVYGGTIAAGTATGMNLTTAWSVNAAFEHLWTPALRTSVYGSYLDVSYNGQATAILCDTFVGGNAAGRAAAGYACNMDYTAWNIGVRTQWEPVRGLIMGLDVIYQELGTATLSRPTGVVLAGVGARPAGTYAITDQSAWGAAFRVQRDFVP